MPSRSRGVAFLHIEFAFFRIKGIELTTSSQPVRGIISSDSAGDPGSPRFPISHPLTYM